jgi:hypothetical protein
VPCSVALEQYTRMQLWSVRWRSLGNGVSDPYLPHWTVARPSTAQRQRWRAGLRGRVAGTPRPRRARAAIGEPADDSERGHGPATATQMAKGADRRAANARTLAANALTESRRGRGQTNRRDG